MNYLGWNKEKQRYIDQSICFIGDAFPGVLRTTPYTLSSHFITVNDRLSPLGLICQNHLQGWGLIREGGLFGSGGLLIFAKKNKLVSLDNTRYLSKL